MKKIHHFKQSLEYERSQAETADNFYRTVLNATEIKRFNSDNEEDMVYQKQDIDVLLTLKGKTYSISEKFRDKDFGDFYIELFSMYPNVRGWMQTGNPDAIMYFTPENAYWISHRTLKIFFDTMLHPSIKTEWFEEIYRSGETILTKRIISGNENYKISVIQAHNQNKIEWKTMGISVPYSWLEKAGVKYKKFDL